MKEIRMQALNQLIPTLRPEDWVYIPERELLMERLRAHDINIALRTEEEADKIREAQQNSEMNQLQIEMMKSEIAKNKAQAMTNITKAKEKNILANKEAQTPPETQNSIDPRMQDAELEAKQAEIDDKRTQTALKQEEAAAKREKMAREMEENQMQSRMKLNMEAEKHKTDLDISKLNAAQDMTLKEDAHKNKMETSKMMAKEKAKQAAKKPKGEGNVRKS
jgi:hypothetical protein